MVGILRTDSWLSHLLKTVDQFGCAAIRPDDFNDLRKQAGIFIAKAGLESIAKSLNYDSKECAPAVFCHRVAQKIVGPGLAFEAALKQFSCRGTCQLTTPAFCG